MRISTIARLGAVVFLATTLAACSSSVKRNGQGATEATSAEVQVPVRSTVASVTVGFSKEGQEQFKDNLKFDPKGFEGTIERTLSGMSLLDEKSGNHLVVTVTDVRVRSTFSAIMWGVMAGSDSITGTVEVKDATGNTLQSFEVDASYALGGWGGGQDGTRLSWLYEEFAKLTASELAGEKKLSSN